MFKHAMKFNADITQWNVEKCFNMIDMFHFARRFNQDISQWETTKLAYMKGMFLDAIDFKIDLSSWDLSNVHDINQENAFQDNVFFNSGMDLLHIRQFYANHNEMYRKRIKTEQEQNIIFL